MSSLHKLAVKRCCLPDNKIGCQLWTVQLPDGYSLGKFGTKTGALDFAHGRINDRAMNAHRNAGKHEAEQDLEFEIEIVDDEPSI